MNVEHGTDLSESQQIQLILEEYIKGPLSAREVSPFINTVEKWIDTLKKEIKNTREQDEEINKYIQYLLRRVEARSGILYFPPNRTAIQEMELEQTKQFINGVHDYLGKKILDVIEKYSVKKKNPAQKLWDMVTRQ